MNDQMINYARQAYRSGDFSTAAQMFRSAKDSSEVAGEVDHLLGNSLMRLGRYSEAVSAYQAALADASYGKRGALLTNQGKARSAMGDLEGAVACFSEATTDGSYATPYKAYLGMGAALEQLGRVTEAGVAYREAALDSANPAPVAALSKLGECFLTLGRPDDAIEVYRAALDYVGPRDDVRAVYAGLGQAAAAANRPSEAVEAFRNATADGLYELSSEQQLAYDQTRAALSMGSEDSQTTAQYVEASAYGQAGAYDPLDPLGKSGSFMPDPSDTGFFTLTESEMIQQDKRAAKVRRKKRHTVLKVFIVLFLLVVLAAGGLAYAYTQGLGYPTQQQTLTALFEAVNEGDDTDSYLSSQLSDSSKAVIVASIPEGATATIDAMDASMTTTTAQVSVELSLGGTLTYEVEFVREGLGWVVSSLTVDLGDATTDSTSATEDEDTSSETDAADEDASADETSESA